MFLVLHLEGPFSFTLVTVSNPHRFRLVFTSSNTLPTHLVVSVLSSDTVVGKWSFGCPTTVSKYTVAGVGGS